MPRGVRHVPTSNAGVPREVVAYLVQNLREQCRPYHGDWTSSWLRSRTDAICWTLDDGSIVDWGIQLPNKTNLAADENSFIRTTAQKIAFLDRTNALTGSGNNKSLKAVVSSLLILIRWMFRNEDIYAPANCAFMRLDTLALKDFVSRLAKGGVPWALEYPQDFLVQMYREALGSLPPQTALDNPFNVPRGDLSAINAWLLSNEYYELGSRMAFRFLNLPRLVSTMGWEIHTVAGSPTFSAFLRLFEPSIKSSVLLPRVSTREYPSHRTPLLSEVQKEGALRSSDHHFYGITAMLSCHRHLPDAIPDSSSIHMPEVRSASSNLLLPQQHTPWIPLRTALSLTNEAIRIVHTLGDAIVDGYLEAARAFAGARTPQSLKARKRGADAVDIPEALLCFNLSGWTSALARSHGNFDSMRRSPGWNDLLAVLVGAVISLTSQLKPSRESELTSLGDDAVRYVDGDGYWIRQGLAKSTRVGRRITVEKPIPRIVAKGLLLVGRLKNGLLSILGEHPDKHRLFLLPDIQGDKNFSLCPLTADRQKTYLDRFCDWVNLPPDAHGRRWYIRTHEGRKSFLITFFWCFRFASLETARWLAGHNDVAHIYAYIEANFPGMELPAIEAEYAAMQMWAFETGDRGETENVVDLYRAVCQHFRVSTISLVDIDDLKQWLTIAFSKGRYKIEPYSIRTRRGDLDTKIFFRITDYGTT